MVVLDAFLTWTKTLTWRKLAITTAAAVVFITMYTVWENRQHTYIRYMQPLTSDYTIPIPSEHADIMFRDFLKAHPQVVMISLLDADPVSNRRTVVKRYFGHKELQTLVEKLVAEIPTRGDGPLLSSNPKLNEQVLSILSGEFACDAAGTGFVPTSFPGADRFIQHSCRVPIPPAFGKSTGWITLHVQGELPQDMYRFKSEALTLSLQFYDSDIARR